MSGQIKRLALELRALGGVDRDELLRLLDSGVNGQPDDRDGVDDDPTLGARFVTLDEFVNVDEPGAAAIVGEDGDALFAEGSDAVFYGDGGAGKTTLEADLAVHLAAGEDWLGIPVPSHRRVLVIENEGPRPPFRVKLRAKRDAWNAAHPDKPTGDRLRVLETPWAKFTFTTPSWLAWAAAQVRELETDVLMVGPVTAAGMDDAGTIAEVRKFMALVADLREQAERPDLLVVLLHHENKAGAVSGAWEGVGDTLLHVSEAGHGHTIVHVQKARWGNTYHGTTMKLAWAPGETFTVEGDRDYAAEIVALLTADPWKTVKKIAAPEADGGIGAGEDKVRGALTAEGEDRFVSRTGEAAEAVGRHRNATVWGVR